MVTIYDMQEYLNDLRSLILDYEGSYTEEYYRRVCRMSMVQLEEELHKFTNRSYSELTGKRVGF